LSGPTASRRRDAPPLPLQTAAALRPLWRLRGLPANVAASYRGSRRPAGTPRAAARRGWAPARHWAGGRQKPTELPAAEVPDGAALLVLAQGVPRDREWALRDGGGALVRRAAAERPRVTAGRWTAHGAAIGLAAGPVPEARRAAARRAAGERGQSPAAELDSGWESKGSAEGSGDDRESSVRWGRSSAASPRSASGDSEERQSQGEPSAGEESPVQVRQGSTRADGSTTWRAATPVEAQRELRSVERRGVWFEEEPQICERSPPASSGSAEGDEGGAPPSGTGRPCPLSIGAGPRRMGDVAACCAPLGWDVD
jgi:hypothetical protein